MPDLVFDLRYLNYAFLVAEHGSFRRAAHSLDLSQSTVSRRIDYLERRLGVRLFDRKRTGVRLTPAGERFMLQAAHGAEQLREAVKEMLLTQRGEIGQVRIGLLASLASGKLGDLLDLYHRMFPRVAVRIEELTPQASAAAILNGRLDAAFIPGTPRVRDCKAVHVWDEQIYAAVPNSHPLTENSSVKWEDLREENFIVSDGAHGPEVEGIILRQLSMLGFRPCITIQRVGRENLLNMVGKSFGVTLVADSARGASYPGVTFLPVESDTEVVGTSLVWAIHNKNPALKKLLELCVPAVRPARPITRPNGQIHSNH